MNNNITEDYCSFEVSKLLKEKGFDSNVTREVYKSDGSNRFCLVTNKYIDETKWFNGVCLKPTHALAIKWIRENFKLHIITQQVWYKKNTEIAYFYMICETPEKEHNDYQDRFGIVLDGSHQEVKGNYINYEKFDKLIFETGFAFKTVEEATEAALLYTLKHLI